MLVVEFSASIPRCRAAVELRWPSGQSANGGVADFNLKRTRGPMTEERLVLAELLEKASDGDFLRAVAEAVLQLLMENDVEGLIGAGRYERSGGRTTWRDGYRDRTLLAGPSIASKRKTGPRPVSVSKQTRQIVALVRAVAHPQ